MPQEHTRGNSSRNREKRPESYNRAPRLEKHDKEIPQGNKHAGDGVPSQSAQRMLVPCQFACPLRVNIPEMLRAAGEADWVSVWGIFTKASPLPFCTAFLCRGECTSACRPRGTEPPVDMPRIARAAAEYALKSDPPEQVPPSARLPRKTGWDEVPGLGERRFEIPKWNLNSKAAAPRFGLEPELEECACAVMEEPEVRVAVVGTTPAALAASYHLAMQGYAVTVFSPAHSAGGWLRTAAAGMQLPLKALQRDISSLKSLGISFETSVNIEPRTLREHGYNVVLAAPDMVNPERRSALVQDRFRGLVDADSFVRAAGRRKVPLPLSIVVLGTGADAVRAARMAAMRGCPDVAVLIHGSPYEPVLNSAESRGAAEDGVKVAYCDLLKTCIRRKPEILEINPPGLKSLKAEMILLDGSIMPHTANDGAEITLGPAVPPALALDVQNMLTDTPGVFAIDPLRLANHSIAEELAQGGRAAAIAREFMEGRKPPTGPVPIWSRDKLHPGTTSSQKERKKTLKPTASAALEAARCSQCNTTITIDYQKCTGCLLCIEACPTGALYATDEAGTPLAHPWRSKPVIHVDRHLCEKSGTCINICPVNAISVRTLALRHIATFGDIDDDVAEDSPGPRIPDRMPEITE